jgi:2-haloacid dehalogenase
MNQTNVKSRAIVFDFGGVLVDWNPRYFFGKYFDGDPRAMEEFLVKIDFTEWNLERDKGRSWSEGIAELCARFPEHQDLIRAYDAHWEESIAGVIPPTVDILQTLKQTGYPLYGLTNWSREKFHLVRPKYEFFNWFDAIVVSGEVKLVKPDPRIFKLFLEMIGRTAGECILVDDSAANIAAARQLGFDTIHFQAPAQLEDALRQLGVIK